MGLMRELKRQAKLAIAPTVFMSLVAYFGWNATQGDRGLRASVVRVEQLKLAKAELARVETEREAWDRRVSGLRTTRLDPDTLDERARAMLNLADPADLVVPYGPGKRLF